MAKPKKTSKQWNCISLEHLFLSLVALKSLPTLEGSNSSLTIVTFTCFLTTSLTNKDNQVFPFKAASEFILYPVSRFSASEASFARHSHAGGK